MKARHGDHEREKSQNHAQKMLWNCKINVEGNQSFWNVSVTNVTEREREKKAGHSSRGTTRFHVESGRQETHSTAALTQGRNKRMR